MRALDTGAAGFIGSNLCDRLLAGGQPDMATHRLIESALTGSEFVMFGDGSQIRDFTYVGDVVEANIAAASTPDAVGQVFNIGGGSAATMHDVVDAVTESVGTAPNISFGNKALGDVFRTGADITAAREVLGWQPHVDLASGVARQVAAVSRGRSSQPDQTR